MSETLLHNSGTLRSSGALKRYTARALELIVAIVLLIAGFQKAADSRGLIEVLRFDAVPEPFVGLVVVVVIVFEVGVGGLLIFGIGRAVVHGLVFAALAIYTIQLVYLLFSQDAPNCSCIKLIESFKSARASHISGLIRNTCMLLAMIVIRNWSPVVGK